MPRHLGLTRNAAPTSTESARVFIERPLAADVTYSSLHLYTNIATICNLGHPAYLYHRMLHTGYATSASQVYLPAPPIRASWSGHLDIDRGILNQVCAAATASGNECSATTRWTSGEGIHREHSLEQRGRFEEALGAGCA